MSQPAGLLVTSEIFNRIREYGTVPPGLLDLFQQGHDFGPLQESLTILLLPALRTAAQTRGRRASGRGLMVVDQRAAGAIWYLEAAVARSAFPSFPPTLWQHLDELLQTYDPTSEVLVVRLFGRAMEVIYFEHDDRMTTLGHGPIPIPLLPSPLAEDRLAGFQLPPEVTMRREQTTDGPAYVFVHATLGELGRTILKHVDAEQQALITAVAGFEDDPMTAERQAVLEPIALARPVLSGRPGGG